MAAVVENSNLLTDILQAQTLNDFGVIASITKKNPVTEPTPESQAK